MAEAGDQIQNQCRETYDRVIALIEERIQSLPPATIRPIDDLSQQHLREDAERESWRLLLEGVQHLKCGGQGHKPGALTEALSRSSLRASAFAATLGVSKPYFAPVPGPVKASPKDQDAALFFCQRLSEAAEGDVRKSLSMFERKIIENERKIAEKSMAMPEAHLAASLTILTNTYNEVCGKFRDSLETIRPLRKPGTPFHPN